MAATERRGPLQSKTFDDGDQLGRQPATIAAVAARPALEASETSHAIQAQPSPQCWQRDPAGGRQGRRRYSTFEDRPE